MSLPRQLKSARMTNSTAGNQIDDKFGEMELSLADILGVTPDVDITESHFLLDNSGRITKALLRQKAAGPVGWRFLDSTSGKEIRICVNGSNLDIDENTGSEGSPSWTNRFRMAIADGALSGALATASRMGLCPQGSGSSSDVLRGDMTFGAVVAGTIPSVRAKHSVNQTIPSGTPTILSFDSEDWDSEAIHSTVTNNSRLTCVTAGKYLVTAGVGWQSNSSGYRRLGVLRNGSVAWAYNHSTPISGASHYQQIRAQLSLSVGDYVTLEAYQTSGSSLTITGGQQYSPFFGMAKVG